MANMRLLSIQKIVNIIFFIALMVALVWIVDVLKNVLLPFCLACLIAYMMEPLVEKNQRWFHRKGRVLPSVMAIVEVSLAIGCLIYFFLPSVVKEINQMTDMFNQATSQGANILSLSPATREWIHRHLSVTAVEQAFELRQFGQLVHSGVTLISDSIGILFHALQWLITFIYVLFILIDYPGLTRGFKMLVPPRYRHIIFGIGRDIQINMNLYFRGQAKIAMCAAVFYCIGFSIVGIPLAIVLGILVGILYMIPYFQYVTLVPVAVVCFLSSLSGEVGFWTLLGECLLVYVISQSICDYVLTPKIMGNALGLNPAIILLSLSVWGTLMGLIGMIIALPLTTLLLGYYQRYVIKPGSEGVTDNMVKQ